MNILWIVEDALRPDRMGCYGYLKNTTPNCDRLAREGVRFQTCIATASHTLPPIVSMIMGQTTATHGIVNPKTFTAWKNAGIRKSTRTPLRILEEHGWLIDGEMVLRWSPLGFRRDTPGDKIEAYFKKNLSSPWFFFAEPYPTHLPYNPPQKYFEMFLDPGYTPTRDTLKRLQVVRQYLIVHPSGVTSKLEAGEKDPLPDEQIDQAHKRTAGTVDLQPEDRPAVNALYDGEVRVFDDLVGRWMRCLENLGILDKTLIIITSDHGEELMERGYVGHASCNLKGTLYEESIRVPWLMCYPGVLPRSTVIKNMVSQIDIMPTVFDLAGLPIPDWMEGRSALTMIRGTNVNHRPEAFAETTPAGWQALESDDREIWCLRTPQWKIVLNTTTRDNNRSGELFNLAQDPGETENLFRTRTDITSTLLPKLDAYIGRARHQRPAVIRTPFWR